MISKYSKEETKNLLNMLLSDDQDNQFLAFKALENGNLENYEGELLILFKYSKLSRDTWMENAPKSFEKLNQTLLKEHEKHLTVGDCLTLLTINKCSKESLELYIECTVKDMIYFLDQMGYPHSHLDINVTLKKNE